MNVNAFLQKDYENEPPSGSKKTKPKQTQFPKGQNETEVELLIRDVLTNSERVTFSLCSFGAQFVGQRKSDEVAEHTDDQAAYSHRRFQQAIPYQHARGTGHDTG